MTFRAVVIGLLCAAAICSVTYFNDFVIRQTHFIGNYMPISVFALLVILVLVVNPLLALVWRRAILKAKELAVVLALCLAACYVPGRGLMHYFTTFLMWPHQYAKTDVSWRKEKILERMPERMIADAPPGGGEALTDFLGGLSKGRRHIAFSDIPWTVWARTLGFWLPLLITFSIGMIALATVIHRQWSSHERLRYPIAEFANALLPRGGRTVADVFRTRGFWIATAAVVSIHTINYLYVWFPDDMIRVRMSFPFHAELAPHCRTFLRGGGWDLLQVDLYFTVIGFAFFLASDLSFSLGIAPYLFTYVVGIFALHGVPIREGGFMALKIQTFLHGGAYFGMFLVLLYMGRRYYWTALRRAFFLPARDRTEAHATWGMRVFLAAGALFAFQLVLVGLDWQLAALYTVGAVIIFTVVCRVVAEGGVFFIHAYNFPCVILWGFMGEEALGPQQLLIMLMVSSLLLIDPREAVLPFVAHGLRLCDMNRVKVGRAAVWGVAALLIAFAVALPVTLYLQYDQGANKLSDGWTRNVPRFAGDSTVSVIQRLRLRGSLAEASGRSGWQRFGHLSPNRDCVLAFGIAAMLVLGFTVGRLRFPKWPIHPVIFIVLGTWQSRRLAASFLVGWLIKVIVTRLMGGRSYQRVKPIMIGLIAGDVIGGIIPMIAGGVYYAVTGQTPKPFRVLPG